MIYAVLFEDDHSHSAQRQEHMAAHLAFLETEAELIQAAGPLRDAVEGSAAGGLWLVRADSAAEVQRLVEADPFWPTGLRKSVAVLEWSQVFADGTVQINQPQP